VTGTPGSFLGGPGLSAWQTGGGSPSSSRPDQPCRHSYPIAVRDPSLATAIGLLLRTLPYVLIHFALLLAFAIGTLIWVSLTIGGGVWLGTHVANAIGWAWAIAGIVLYSYLWYAVLRYALHLLECGHVAVLTQLILHNQVGAAGESMMSHGIRLVRQHIAQVTVLYGLHAVIRGVVDSFNRTVDFFAELLPIPGLESILYVLRLILRAATRYIDKAIFSYNLARGDDNPWRSSQDGIIYYCQNAKEILKKSVWIVILDKLLTFVVWLLLLAPAVGVALLLPNAVREWGTVAYMLIAGLFAFCVRATFVKPLFLIIILIRFHTLIENQPINETWDGYLSGLSNRFAGLKTQAQAWASGRTAPV
jgi:hypothetical protein